MQRLAVCLYLRQPQQFLINIDPLDWLPQTRFFRRTALLVPIEAQRGERFAPRCLFTCSSLHQYLRLHPWRVENPDLILTLILPYQIHSYVPRACAPGYLGTYVFFGFPLREYYESYRQGSRRARRYDWSLSHLRVHPIAARNTNRGPTTQSPSSNTASVFAASALRWNLQRACLASHRHDDSCMTRDTRDNRWLCSKFEANPYYTRLVGDSDNNDDDDDGNSSRFSARPL